ncbi:TRNA/rRNA methyltransferase family protein [Tripterygium wilfordii]|uniref:tRNA/rRNA methyltransferase family protein n=1 Tax=Tripterygium wilfordii TaxID=458696 RepID=A0A7J7CVF5_TRIWF|nr:TRNA/rRNA methyltransferase family protein [Tripterygium wilfordii]
MKIPTSFSYVDISQYGADCKTWFPFPHRILVLDGIQDPCNVGNLIRSAVTFRWGGVFLLPGCCDPFNEKALRASQGASFQLRIVSGSWNDLEALENEFQLQMLAGHSDSDGEMRRLSSLSQGFTESVVDVPLCFVLGSEGLGLSEKSRQKCELVSIPMAGKFESLYVSVAGGILQPRN